MGDSCEKGNKYLGSISDRNFLMKFVVLNGVHYEVFCVLECDKI
jgi:hypothetical protein